MPAPSSTFAGRLLLNLTDPLVVYKGGSAALISLTVCENPRGNFGFNTTKICSTGTATGIAFSNLSALVNASTVLSTTQLPTIPSQSGDTAATTSTLVVALSLVTISDGSISTITITPGTASTTRSFTITSSGANTATTTSAACGQLQPLGGLFWLKWITTKACAQILHRLRDWVDAEKAKAFLSANDGQLQALKAKTTHHLPTIVGMFPTVTKSAVVVLVSATCLLGLAVLISLLC